MRIAGLALMASLTPLAVSPTARAEAGVPNPVEELTTPKAPIPAEDTDAGPDACDAGPAIQPRYETRIVGERPDLTLTGSSATVVTRPQLEALPGGDTQTIAHLVEMQPGIVADNTFGFATHVRGADGAVLYVIDGIPMFPPPLGSLGQTQDTLPTRLVQSLEVLTGGFPVEYGYALGGVVDVVTRRPAAEPTAEAQLTYGSYNLTDVAADYSQSYGKLSAVASADFIQTDRGFDTPDAIEILHDYRIGGNGFAKLDYEIDSHDRLSLIGTYEEDQFQIPIDPTMLPLSDAPPGAIRGPDVYGNPPPPFVPYDANPTDFERNVFAALSYVHAGAVNSQVSVFARESYTDMDCDPAGTLGPTADPGSFCSSISRDSFHYGGLASLAWHWLTGNEWKAGVQVDDQPSSVGYSLYTRDDASPSGGPNAALTLRGGDDVNTLSLGAYLEDRIELGRLTLLPGLRFDVQNTTFGSSSEPNDFLTGPSARLGGSYALTNRVILHAFVGYLSEMPVNYDGPVAAQILQPSLVGQLLPVDLKAATTESAELGVTIHPARKLTLGLWAWGRLTQNMLDRQDIGNSLLVASFNWAHGRAAGGDFFGNGQIVRFLEGRLVVDGFGNLSYQDAQQLQISSEQYLFTPAELAAAEQWTTMDHVQFWTANVGLVLHDSERQSNLAVRFNYGSGFHSGIATNEEVPEHATVDVTASHTFKFPGRPEVAFDVFNLFNDIYAYRLGTAFFGNSQYAALQHFDLRLIVHFG